MLFDIVASSRFPNDYCKAVTLLQFFVRLWFKYWSLFCPNYFLISPSFGALKGLYFGIVAFPGYLQLYFDTKKKIVTPKGDSQNSKRLHPYELISNIEQMWKYWYML